MSKFILWIGFILSIIMLALGIFNFQNAKPLFLIVWVTIFLGSGYKLFFSSPER